MRIWKWTTVSGTVRFPSLESASDGLERISVHAYMRPRYGHLIYPYLALQQATLTEPRPRRQAPRRLSSPPSSGNRIESPRIEDGCRLENGRPSCRRDRAAVSRHRGVGLGSERGRAGLRLAWRASVVDP